MTARPDLAEIERQWMQLHPMASDISAFGTSLLARVRELEAALEWRPIETAPRRGEDPDVLVYEQDGYGRPCGNVRKAYWEGRWKEAHEGSEDVLIHGEVTHWLPLPPPPKEPT